MTSKRRERKRGIKPGTTLTSYGNPETFVYDTDSTNYDREPESSSVPDSPAFDSGSSDTGGY